MTSTLEDARDVGVDQAAVAIQRRATAGARGIKHLLLQRPDLVGVYLLADLTAEAVTWSV